MSRRLLIALSATFAGLTVVLVVISGYARSPVPLFAAVPLGMTGAVMWIHATGRLPLLADHRTVRRGGRWNPSFRRGTDRRERGGERTHRYGANSRASDDDSRHARGRARRSRGRTRRSQRAGNLSDAYRTLGLDPGADPDSVRRAYREAVKRVHPDTDGGDEEAFKRVNAAYDRLTD